MGLGSAELSILQIGLLAANGPAELPEVQADLIGASCQRTDFEDRSAILQPLEHLEFRRGGAARCFVDGSKTIIAWGVADRAIAAKGIF